MLICGQDFYKVFTFITIFALINKAHHAFEMLKKVNKKCFAARTLLLDKEWIEGSRCRM
jgi:hypothetical protein